MRTSRAALAALRGILRTLSVSAVGRQFALPDPSRGKHGF
jgi:hypothetical protein